MAATNRKISELAQDYYNELKHAIETGHINFNKFHFAEDIVLVGPLDKVEGKKNVEKMYNEMFLPYLHRFDIARHFADNTTVCTILDYVTKTHAGVIPTVEWMKFHDQKIFEIQIFYDTAKWAKFTEGKKQRSA